MDCDLIHQSLFKATNSDLNQLKLSLDELERRKQAHQSKHAETVKTERMTKEAIKGKFGQSAVS